MDSQGCSSPGSAPALCVWMRVNFGSLAPKQRWGERLEWKKGVEHSAYQPMTRIRSATAYAIIFGYGGVRCLR